MSLIEVENLAKQGAASWGSMVDDHPMPTRPINPSPKEAREFQQSMTKFFGSMEAMGATKETIRAMQRSMIPRPAGEAAAPAASSASHAETTAAQSADEPMPAVKTEQAAAPDEAASVADIFISCLYF